ncbi:MAG: CaiB/BaiF CoA transferase family protein [Acidimicrobiales bacterium]
MAPPTEPTEPTDPSPPPEPPVGEPGTGPLAGVRVLDLTSVVMGPYATQVLGDLGADVITIESLRGDTNRVMGPGPHPQLSGVSLNLLRNKRNVALDITTVGGREAALRIAEGCDVFVTNVRPGGLRRARLTYEDVAARRADVIYCEAHGWPTGSEREDEPAYDDVIQAASGVADAARLATGQPALAPTILADKVCGLSIVYAVCAALFRRERTGRGDHIEVPMADTTTAFMLVEHGSRAVARPPQGPAGYPRILTPERRPQQTTDGWVNVLPYSQRHYEDLFREGGRDDLIGDTRYTDFRARILHSDFLYAQVRAILATRSTEAWLTFCRNHAIPATEVVTLDELVDGLPEAEHPVTGTYKVVPPPVLFSEAPSDVRRPAPLIGQHTDEVLAEAGYGVEEIKALRASRMIPEAPF